MTPGSPSIILAISGSLRARSTNTEVLRAAAMLAPAGVRVRIYSGLAALPHFNPDLDTEGARLPPPVEALRAEVGEADALLICSPEYAHGVPGALKNALDWLVSGPEMPYKPIGLLNASERSVHAQASLAETLRTMSAIIVPGASPTLGLQGRHLDAGAMVSDADLAESLRSALRALGPEVEGYRARRSALG
jgi:NAD(P)H-dependent FMN reductase